MLIEALYRGKSQHLSLQAGGNDLAQLKIPSVGVVTTAEKHTLTHSRHTGMCFFAVTWDQLPPAQSESEGGPTEPLSPGVPPGTYYDDEKLFRTLMARKGTSSVLSTYFQTGNRLLTF